VRFNVEAAAAANGFAACADANGFGSFCPALLLFSSSFPVGFPVGIALMNDAKATSWKILHIILWKKKPPLPLPPAVLAIALAVTL
jgi:hypothetical protein